MIFYYAEIFPFKNIKRIRVNEIINEDNWRFRFFQIKVIIEKISEHVRMIAQIRVLDNYDFSVL